MSSWASSHVHVAGHVVPASAPWRKSSSGRVYPGRRFRASMNSSRLMSNWCLRGEGGGADSSRGLE